MEVYVMLWKLPGCSGAPSAHWAFLGIPNQTDGEVHEGRGERLQGNGRSSNCMGEKCPVLPRGLPANS
jgi:hypothetical protein